MRIHLDHLTHDSPHSGNSVDLLGHKQDKRLPVDEAGVSMWRFRGSSKENAARDVNRRAKEWGEKFRSDGTACISAIDGILPAVSADWDSQLSSCLRTDILVQVPD